MTGNGKYLLSALALVFLSISAATGGQSLWIGGKAQIAQLLLNRAWEQSVQSGKPHPPWPWADIVPVAKLTVPAIGISMIVLNDASGESMAFGPGLVSGDPNIAGTSTLAFGGHRDTHLRFLETLPDKSRLRVQNLKGEWHHYQLSKHQIVDSRVNTIALASHHPGLVLITCYPFNATQTGGPLRFVAIATAVDESIDTTTWINPSLPQPTETKTALLTR